MSRMKHHFDSAPATTKAGNMQGFDPEFSDIVDYILRITYRIWEGKQVGLCYDYYSEDCPVYTLAGYSAGAEEVTQNTLNTLAAFPDRTLKADNIIWGGDDQSGFHTSHLISTSMTNLGDSEFGPASGKHATIQVIAHCVVKDNRIIEEWLVRDNYSLAEQLGFDPQTFAKTKAAQPVEARFRQWLDAELARVPSVTTSDKLPTEVADNEAYLMAVMHNIWNAKMLGDVHKVYAEDAQLHASANRELNGRDEITSFYLDFMGTFSDLRVALDYSCQQPNKKSGMDVAIRWTMSGKHTGGKLFGAPTNADILVLGESQYHIEGGLIREEWTVFDQLAILTQIERARLASA